MFQYSSRSLFSGMREELKVGFLLLCFACSFLVQNALLLLALLVSLSLLLSLSGYRGFRGLFLGVVPFLAIADIGFLLFLADTGVDIVALTVVSNLRVLCLFSATAFFTFSTDVYALLKAMQRLRFPETFYLPAFVLFRFLPELDRDFSEIAGLQRMRGVTKRNPVLFFRSVLVPLLFTALQKSDELAIAYYLRKKRERLP